MPEDVRSASLARSKTPNSAGEAAELTLLDGTQSAFTRWLRGMVAVAQEITQFTQVRLQEDMAALSMLAACASPEQAVECQRRFAAKASEHYAEEMMKLSRMMIIVASQGLSLYQPMTDKARERAPAAE